MCLHCRTKVISRNVEVHAYAEDFIGGIARGDDNGFNAWVGGEDIESGYERVAYLICEAVASGRPMEFDDYNGGDGWRCGRVVGEDDVGESKGVVAFGECWCHFETYRYRISVFSVLTSQEMNL